VAPRRAITAPRAGLLALGAIAAAAIPASAAATKSTVPLFQDPSRTAICGIELHASSSPAELLCQATGVPRAKHGEGDPAVQLGRTVRPQLLLISQDSYVSNKLKTLAKGTVWSSGGITCQIGSNTIRCSNPAQHGFTIGNGRYKSF
jgi:hypothetical protein